MKQPRTSVHVALIHWPVFDRAKNIVVTNVTNFDIHDIARAGRTYGIGRYSHFFDTGKFRLLF